MVKHHLKCLPLSQTTTLMPTPTMKYSTQTVAKETSLGVETQKRKIINRVINKLATFELNLTTQRPNTTRVLTSRLLTTEHTTFMRAVQTAILLKPTNDETSNSNETINGSTLVSTTANQARQQSQRNEEKEESNKEVFRQKVMSTSGTISAVPHMESFKGKLHQKEKTETDTTTSKTLRLVFRSRTEMRESFLSHESSNQETPKRPKKNSKIFLNIYKFFAKLYRRNYGR